MNRLSAVLLCRWYWVGCAVLVAGCQVSALIVRVV